MIAPPNTLLVIYMSPTATNSVLGGDTFSSDPFK